MKSRWLRLSAVPVGEHRTLPGDAIDVRRLVAHHAHVVGGNVELADVVTPDDENIGFLSRTISGVGLTRKQQGAADGHDRPQQSIHFHYTMRTGN